MQQLIVTTLLIVHMCASVWYCLGRVMPFFQPDGALTWLYAHEDYVAEGVTFDRESYFALRSNSSTGIRYAASFYWVAGTLTANGSVGSLLPQNELEIMWTIFLMILNMPLFRWIVGEVSSIIMRSDEAVVQARQHLEKVFNVSDARSR